MVPAATVKGTLQVKPPDDRLKLADPYEEGTPVTVHDRFPLPTA
jgi:hypothetical protein